jgi:alginate O-acetyltransferase complex protein AlgI
MSWRWDFGILMLIVSSVNFYAGRKIAMEVNRRAWMLITAVISLLPLLYFKYANFFLESLTGVVQAFGKPIEFPVLNVILPVGISFFTFQALSYSIDIYRRKIEPEPSLVKFLTFVAFFPQLVAGPIERTTNILPQFEIKKRFNGDLAIFGAKLFIWGLFKKVVIADRLSLYVDPVYDNPGIWSSPTFLFATFFFTVQIYCDFSGYTDMAIGIARIMGFRLMQNFNLPYWSSSISDFWKRWHISLSTWFADYMYIPLGGNRVTIPRWMFNILLVFLVSGLWHGANWTFVVWGALHGSYYLLEYFGRKGLKLLGHEEVIQKMWFKWLKVPIIFMLVMIAWIFFRANSIGDALLIIERIFSWEGPIWWGSSAVTSVLSILLIVLLIGIQILQLTRWVGIYDRHSRFPKWVSAIAFVFLLLGISLFGVSSNAFIYFQF